MLHDDSKVEYSDILEDKYCSDLVAHEHGQKSVHMLSAQTKNTSTQTFTNSMPNC